MAEGVGFEPTEPFGSPVFKTGAIDHSTTPPLIDYQSLTLLSFLGVIPVLYRLLLPSITTL